MNNTAPSGPDAQQQQRQKRTRIVLSCAPCRASKLKCDRETPCGQCRKKEREDLCHYAPKPVKRKPERRNRNMAERLKRLEGMVRGMMDENGEMLNVNVNGNEGGGGPISPASSGSLLLQQLQQQQQLKGTSTTQSSEGTELSGGASPLVKGQVVGGHNAGTYVGATHCMAMLEDIEDLKCYFEDNDGPEEDDVQGDDIGSPDILFSRKSPMSKDELLAQLPDQNVADRLITRYFASMSPSQHIVHRPSFTKQYAAFWQSPESSSYHWLAQLFMMLSMGMYYNKYQAPHELEGDSPIPAKDRLRHYKSCAAWAIVSGKYTQPTITTLRALLLYVESDFILNRAAQMDCYILSGVIIRLMFKMGLHRDPSKLVSISPFEGEMRRRMWNMAIQVESLVSFHMGLPSMFIGIESDTEVPRNLRDDDFDDTCEELPPGRPDSDWTSITYPIHKTRIVRVFGKIAGQAHALSPCSYSDVLRLDKDLERVWNSIPSFIKVRPLSESVGDPPTLLIQRFGLSALHCKCICVLHRRYLAEAIPNPQHNFSRQQCLDAAVTLLKNQSIIWEASKPGQLLSDQGWFLTSLAVHDYLLAAMVVYLVIQNEHYENPNSEHGWTSRQQPAHSKRELKEMIRSSQEIWARVADGEAELRKTAETLSIMLARLGSPVRNQTDEAINVSAKAGTISPIPETVDSGNYSMPSSNSAPNLGPGAAFSNTSEGLSSLDFNTFNSEANNPFGMPQTSNAMNNANPFLSSDIPGEIDMTSLDLDSSWMMPGANLDWRFLDISMAHSHTAGSNLDGPGPVWTERPPLDEMDMSLPTFWGSPIHEPSNTMHP